MDKQGVYKGLIMMLIVYINNRFNEADLKAEEAERNVSNLEQELSEKEQLHEELQEKYKTAKAELDELARQFDEL